jgi:type IV secretion system protein VirB11
MGNNVFKHYYAVLAPHLSVDGVTDLFINHSGSVYVASYSEGVKLVDDVNISDDFIDSLAKVIASTIDKSNKLPIISSAFPTGERIELIQAGAAKHTCLAIRKPTKTIFTIDDLNTQGIFNSAKINPGRESVANELCKQLVDNQTPVAEILKQAVENRLNIVISGATGSAKTTLSKALIQHIPKHERLITLEDAEELTTPDHHNSVHLFYPRERSDGLITANTLLLSCLRFKPDRILLSEVRGAEAYDFLDSVNTGHPGAITTIHATSHLTAISRLVQMVRYSPAAHSLSVDDIEKSITDQVDLFLHMENRRLKTVYFPRFQHD